ncbi:hypothetical protein ABZ686_02955 [Streptomyces sp. NPDC006992]|uniref:hypothetical protein n=1 Tax=Streptomyces sp. NPDC006992 TaxID=3155601 RepID=UPI0033D6835D
MKDWLSCRRAEAGSWELRESIRARVSELRAILDDREAADAEAADPESKKGKLLADAREELQLAEEKISEHHSGRYKNASHVIVGQIHLDAAHNILLRLSELHDLVPMLPGALAFARENLQTDDPRRTRMEKITQRVSEGVSLDEEAREALLDAMGAARQVNIREKMRIRSFVYIVWWVMLGLTAIAIAVAVLGGISRGALPLCFTPEQSGVGRLAVCPLDMARLPKDPARVEETRKIVTETTRPADYLVVELVGLVAACIAATVTLRRMRGTTTPFGVPLTLALLKLPTGALTAVLGILLMRGAFIPGLTDLDSPGQIIAWAIVFGYAQQLFTHLVDNQAQSVLSTGGNSKTHRTPEEEEKPGT